MTEHEATNDIALIDAARRGDADEVRRLLAPGRERAGDRRERRDGPDRRRLRRPPGGGQAADRGGGGRQCAGPTRQSAYLIPTADGSVEFLRLTLQAGADRRRTDSYNGTGLIRAADRGHVEVIRELLTTDIAVNHVNRLGWTALLEAIILGDGGPRHTEVVRLLIGGGADVNLADGNGVTPLAHAQRRGQEAIVPLLQAAGAR